MRAINNDLWIYPDVSKPYNNAKVMIYIDGGQFVGKWVQEATYINGHFIDQGNILDDDIISWTYADNVSTPKKEITHGNK